MTAQKITKILAPQSWREYPVFWYEAIKFKLEMIAYRTGFYKPK